MAWVASVLVRVLTKMCAAREYTPNVIEPSFGIGRILYSLLEHVYWVRQGSTDPKDKEKELNERGVLSLPPAVAPIKVLIVPLSANEAFRPLIRDICGSLWPSALETVRETLIMVFVCNPTAAKLRRLGLASRVDDSNASIGKRYSRNDELGTPFGLTIDFASVKNNTVTIRYVGFVPSFVGPQD